MHPLTRKFGFHVLPSTRVSFNKVAETRASYVNTPKAFAIPSPSDVVVGGVVLHYATQALDWKGVVWPLHVTRLEANWTTRRVQLRHLAEFRGSVVGVWGVVGPCV